MIGLLLLLGCQRDCPPGFSQDAERARSIEAMAQVKAPGMCFGPASRSNLGDDGGLRMSDLESEPDAAARLLHLMQHMEQAAPSPGPDCLARWLELEAAAWVVELQARQRLALGLRYPFEADWRGTGDAKVIHAWLDRNPQGGGGVDALAAGYARSCEEKP